MNNYYIPFLPMADINYLYLFSLYDIAEYNTITSVFDTVKYKSQKALSNDLNISTATLTRILKNEAYNGFFEANTKDKTITLKNNFKGSKQKQYVILTAKEVSLIRHKQDNLLAKYLIYIKYYCGFTKNNTDFTAKQFINACGYSDKSNDLISRISSYNKILVDENLIKIIKYRDKLGHERNKYIYL